MDVYEIEFCSDRWIKRRKENLYYKTYNKLNHLKLRIISIIVLVVSIALGLFLVGRGDFSNLYDSVIPEFYGLAICISVCVIALFGFFASFRVLQFRLPGIKLDYDGSYSKDVYHLCLRQDKLEVTINGVCAIYHYSDLKQIYKDKKGILLKDIDLYIPLEVIERTKRPLVYQRFKII